MTIVAWLPPVLADGLRRCDPRRVRWTGRFASWDAAMAAAGSGYATPAILERAEAAVREVLAGRAAYERDGAYFTKPEIRPGLLAALLRVHACTGSLQVVDWGGALASAWVQHRCWLADLPGVRWSVVEQPSVVASGRRLFSPADVTFHADPIAACAAGVDAVMWSASLQYFPDPAGAVRLAAGQASWLCMDRLALVDEPVDRITMQRVPARLGGACYPCRFFARQPWDVMLAELGFREEFSWPALDDAGLPRTAFRGILYRRR